MKTPGKPVCRQLFRRPKPKPGSGSGTVEPYMRLELVHKCVERCTNTIWRYKCTWPVWDKMDGNRTDKAYEWGHHHLLRTCTHVALMVSHEATRALLFSELMSPWILIARFNSRGRQVTIVQCYSPTNAADDEVYEEFVDQIKAIMERATKRDLKILIEDLNGKVGYDNTGKELILGKHSIRVHSGGALLT